MDGPFLSALKRYKARATFFLVASEIAKYPDGARRLVAEGMEVANHTATHADLTALDPAEAADEIAQGRAAVTTILGRAPPLFRPPFGRGLDAPWVQRAVQAAGEQMVGWTFSFDHHLSSAGLDVGKALGSLVRSTRPGAIVLLHDNHVDPAGRTFDEPETQTLLPLYLAAVTAKGYRVVTVSQLIAIGRKAGATGRKRSKRRRSSPYRRVHA